MIAVFVKTANTFWKMDSAATQNILLAAHGLGIGSCWIAGDKKDYAPEVADILGVPAGFRLISLVALGYPAEQPQKAKRPLSEVLHWERF